MTHKNAITNAIEALDGLIEFYDHYDHSPSKTYEYNKALEGLKALVDAMPKTLGDVVHDHALEAKNRVSIFHRSATIIHEAIANGDE